MREKVDLTKYNIEIKGEIKNNLEYLLKKEKIYFAKYKDYFKEYEYKDCDVTLHERIDSKSVKKLFETLNDYYNEDLNMRKFYVQRNIKFIKEYESEKMNCPLDIINGKVENKKYRKYESVFFPFGVNESQYTAVKSALENQYSVIEGPPGTGKTQTILNIIANLLIDDKSICVISSNNSAVDNVYEKLESDNLSHVMANIGSKDKTINFFVNQQSTKSKESNSNISLDKIAKGFINVQNNLKIDNKIAELKNDMHETKIEYNHVRSKLDGKSTECGTLVNLLGSNGILKYINFMDSKIYNLFNKEYNYDKLLSIYIIYYEKYICELESKIKKLNKRVKTETTSKLIDQSKKILFQRLNDEKYFDSNFTKDSYIDNFIKFIKSYPVIGTTSASIYSTKGIGYKYDYLIIDEASQMNIYDGLTAVTCAKNIIVVGDEMQLQPVITNNDYLDIGNVDVREGFLSMFNSKIRNVNNVMLKEHYRCDRSIINFCNIFFYNKKLKIHTSFNGKTMTIDNCKNKYEVEWKTKLLLNKGEVIISPYKNSQTDTVYSFQGREASHVYFSIEKDYLTKFTRDERLINVAVSRAKNNLTLISKDFAHDNSIVGHLFKYIKYYTYNELEYEPTTLFTKLYKNKKCGKMSPAEQIIASAIEQIKTEMKQIDYLHEYRLNALVDSALKYSEEHWRFIMAQSHIDFLIYDISNNTPLLAIEVDGYTYHNSEDSRRRDELKNQILKINKLPLIRLNTRNESNELSRIKNEINIALKNVE